MTRDALVIMAKEPASGSVKTRLIGHLPDDRRLELYVSLLQNTISRLRSIPGVDAYITFSPQEADRYFEQFGLDIFPQSEGSLGKRMYHAARQALDRGYQKVVLVGVDIPEISGSIIVRALELLSDHDIVFGPARDGGYYLVGMKQPDRRIFEGIQWSTDQTLQQSIDRARVLGWSVALTDMLSDIDTIEDLKSTGFWKNEENPDGS